ncbi:MAG: SpoIIE family protein phosphatase [bacterium]|nr:SpoIIE family protein phosphatase [bacterium]
MLTNIAYIFFSAPVFQLLLWTFVLLLVLRLLLIVKKKLFWKIRNRLIFSGLFLVATPLFFVTLFFYFTSTLVMTQYGMVIMRNLMENQLTELDKFSDLYLNVQRTKLTTIPGLGRIMPIPISNVAIFEKKEEKYKLKTYLPQSFDMTGIPLKEFKGYFMVNKVLYYGLLKKRGDYAVVTSFTVTQPFLDTFATASDFKIRFQSPSIIIDKNETAATRRNRHDLPNFPLPFKYKYLDFDSAEKGHVVEKTATFWIFLDFSKIIRKISDVDSGVIQYDVKSILYLVIFLFGTFIFISLAIGIRSVRVITRSLNLITNGTQRIRNGDFSYRIRTKSGDQLQYLGESFNEMAAGIDRLLVDEKEKQRLEEELRIARSIQLKLLPADTFETPEFEIAAVNIPATEIAGDYFDYFYKAGSHLSMLVADVSGKGASAAFYMAELKGVINHLQKEDDSPALLIASCHDSLYQSFDRVTFITMNMARINIPEKKFLFARAGHTQALFYSTREKECIELFPDGIAIGLPNFSKEKITEIEVDYHSGDILFLFSDGLSEIMNDEEEMLGVENIKTIFNNNHHLSAQEIKKKLLDFSIAYSETEANSDDLTFIILKVK